MLEEHGPAQSRLEARSPFELRVDLGKDVPEETLREALASGTRGFLHSFRTGSTVDGPGVRVVAWTTGCMWRCLYRHNPDTWNSAAQAMGIHTALDTNGHFGDRLTDADLETIDLVLLDIKTWDPERHRRLTGRDVGPTLEFARRLAAHRRSVWLFLPFHQMGRFKWKQLGIAYTLEQVEPPSAEAVERACSVVRAAGLTAY